MLVSVVVCTYSEERYDVFTECVESVLKQTHEPLELVLVVDGNDDVFEMVQDEFGDVDGEVSNLVLHNNEENRGISYSRTKGAELATGEIVAFIDDDGVAEPDWIETLVEVYEDTDVLAAGGYVAPDWLEGKPSFFPEEFNWLVGCTEKGFAEDGEEVRNVYGSNISYRRNVFLDVGGYDVNTGRKGDRHIQAHEAPVGIRIQEEYGRGMIYVHDAVVNHQLFSYRGDFRWLMQRSFWQGFSKRVMDVLYPDSQGSERTFLKKVYFSYLPTRFRRAVLGPSLTEVKQIVAILLFTSMVALGYGYGVIKRDILREA